MKDKRKICIITGSRAEWGLFYPLAKDIKSSGENFTLQIIATGAHLSNEYGSTYKEIENDGFTIDLKVDVGLVDDTAEGTIRSIASGMTGISEALSKLKPDIVLLLGDRFETFAAASACLFMKVPVAHMHGGEVTEGSLDDTLRHVITKIATIHFVATDPYRKRVIQMGEDPLTVFNVGAIGIDNIKNTELLDRKAFEGKTGFRLGDRNVLITFNPPTAGDAKVSIEQFSNLVEALDAIEDLRLIFTKPNPDMYSRAIADLVDDYVSKRPKKSIAFTTMGRVLYLSAMNLVDIVAGNSSSGIIEAPSFGIPTVNVGDRQKGRLRADSVLDCDGTLEDIKKTLEEAFSRQFRNSYSQAKNPYGEGNTAKRIVEVIAKMDLSGVKKRFFDIDFET